MWQVGSVCTRRCGLLGYLLKTVPALVAGFTPFIAVVIATDSFGDRALGASWLAGFFLALNVFFWLKVPDTELHSAWKAMAFGGLASVVAIALWSLPLSGAVHTGAMSMVVVVSMLALFFQAQADNPGGEG